MIHAQINMYAHNYTAYHGNSSKIVLTMRTIDVIDSLPKLVESPVELSNKASV